MILETSPDSSAVVRSATAIVLYLHIAGGTVGILSGAAALVVRKGGQTHRLMGNVFFVSMLIMATIGAVTSPFLPKPQWGNVFMGALVFYLLTTSRMTIRHKEGTVGRFEYGAFIVALSITLAALVAGTLAMNTPNGILIDDLHYLLAFGFAAIWALVAAADLKIISRGGVFGAQRILRHLWRMCAALLVAVFSLFLGQQQVFPDSIRGTGLLYLPVLAVVVAMIFWILRVRIAKRWR
jgi:uncharacterized membrane protein